MANTASAKKALRSSLKKRVFNVRRKRAMRDAVKDIGVLIAQKKKKEAEALLPQAYSAIDKAQKRGVMKKNTAARKKSRLVVRIRRIS
ncbi:30S ribosomal protein S20 [Candidatus Kaiserbacteria bacterium]|nr:30S ribosomal protein S20 [Candidatus Kaiserbacteria bacterium]